MNTTIYAITDSHQESRNLSRLLSEIYNVEKDNSKPCIILDAGDLFKGIYDKDMSVNAYLKIKELLPNSEIILTIGNNDFGFIKKDFEYLKKTVEKFHQSGISVVCANLTDSKTNLPIENIKKYKILDINGERILITGFCLDNSCAKKFKCELAPPEQCFIDLINSITEQFDKIVVLNHHWYTYSKSLLDFANSKGVKIDLIIGGHEHSPIPPDYENNIYYPLSFARTMYKISNTIEQIPLEKCNFIPQLELPIIEYERQTRLKAPLANRVLNLTKCYSDACPLGTFISDEMKRLGNTDIAFHSTGFTMYPLRLEDSKYVTRYDLERVMCNTDATIETIEITVEQLKKVFENAAEFRMLKNQGNAKFLQCSQNIEIQGRGNKQDNTYEIFQISINGEKLLDKTHNPIDSKRKFTCTIDPFIGSGEQGFEVLKNIPKTKILKNGKEIKINDMFYSAVINAEKFYTNPNYPSFKFTDL